MNDLIIVTLITSGIFYGTPLIIAGIGELLNERGGVLNLSVEGNMLMGAATAFWVSQSIVDAPDGFVLGIAFLTAAVVGSLISLVLAVAAITMRANQVVVGLALLVLCGPLGLSNYVGVIGNLSSKTGIHRLPKLNVFGLADLPILGPILFSHDIMVYLSWGLVIVTGLYLNKTRLGLHLRAVGDDPAAADAMGVPVVKYRYAHTIIGGALSGTAGAYYSLAIAPNWTNNLTAGAGWIAIAIVILAFWRPFFVMIAAYLFGIATSLGFTLQALGYQLPAELFTSMPYVFTVIAVALASSSLFQIKVNGPVSLGRPFIR